MSEMALYVFGLLKCLPQEFPCIDDTCYLAHCFPYSYSQLLLHMSKLEATHAKSRYFATENLCFTLAGNTCPLLTITNFDGQHKINLSSHINIIWHILEPEKQPRMGIVITSRVHPGETNSSWIMQGLLDFLTSDSTYAKVSHCSSSCVLSSLLYCT